MASLQRLFVVVCGDRMEHKAFPSSLPELCLQPHITFLTDPLLLLVEKAENCKRAHREENTGRIMFDFNF